jgi:hypothetical protein
VDVNAAAEKSRCRDFVVRMRTAIGTEHSVLPMLRQRVLNDRKRGGTTQTERRKHEDEEERGRWGERKNQPMKQHRESAEEHCSHPFFIRRAEQFPVGAAPWHILAARIDRTRAHPSVFLVPSSICPLPPLLRSATTPRTRAPSLPSVARSVLLLCERRPVLDALRGR